MKGSRKKRRVLRAALVGVCVIVLATCALFIGQNLYEKYRTDKLDESVREMYRGKTEEEDRYAFSLFPSAYAESASEDTAQKEPDETPQDAIEDAVPEVQSDFLELYAENEHIVGWLTMGESIDYPVVQYDNEYYLTHNFFGKGDSNGTLFVNMDNRLWPRDDVLLIHGHNMKSGAMFGRLTRYEKYDYLCKYPIVTFRTIFDAEDVHYVPVAGFNASMIQGNSDYFDIMQLNFENDIAEESASAEAAGRQSAAFQQYLDDVRTLSLWESPVEVDVNDELLMLVTCSYKNEDGRFILICRKLRDGETPETVAALFPQD